MSECYVGDWESSGKSRLVVVAAPVEINLHTHKCEEEISLLYCSTLTVLSDLVPAVARDGDVLCVEAKTVV
jgi:hypothetical protein